MENPINEFHEIISEIKIFFESFQSFSDTPPLRRDLIYKKHLSREGNGSEY